MKFCLFLLQFIFFSSVSGQNLIPNPSFEYLSSCPDEFYQIRKAPPWFSPDCGTNFPDHGYAVLFNGCNYSFAGVPANSVCTQSARTGNGYAGIEVLSILGPNHYSYRQYIETEMKATLEKGKNYYFSMYFNLCDRFPGFPLCFQADSLGALFTNSVIDKNPQCNVLPLSPDVHPSSLQIQPGSQWHKIDGCYTAKGGEKYITIGNYAAEDKSNCSALDTFAYFLFIDDINLIAEVSKTIDTTLCPGKTWEIDAKDLRGEYKSMEGWTYRWSNGETSSKHTFSKTGNERLTVSLNGCFNDVYDFNIKVDASCSCQVFAPNAFTPNGDGLNDEFRPQISCLSIQPSNYSLTIYNRWGEKIFYTADRTKGWNGTSKSKGNGTEAFLWLIRYDINVGSGIEHKSSTGSVVTIR